MFPDVEFIKTILNGLQNGYKKLADKCDSILHMVESQASKISTLWTVRPDWNQSDSSALDFVKNRTHYEDEVFVDMAGKSYEVTIAMTTVVHDEIPLALGQRWNIAYRTSNGSLSEFGECDVMQDDTGQLYIGDLACSTFPCCIRKTTAEFNSTFGRWYNGLKMVVTCVSGGVTNTVLRKIDGKFLPPYDWNQNDPAAPGYIENRTHWEELEVVLDDDFRWTGGRVSKYVAFTKLPAVGAEYQLSMDGEVTPGTFLVEQSTTSTIIARNSRVNISITWDIPNKFVFITLGMAVDTSPHVVMSRTALQPLDPKFLPSFDFKITCTQNESNPNRIDVSCDHTSEEVFAAYNAKIPMTATIVLMPGELEFITKNISFADEMIFVHEENFGIIINFLDNGNITFNYDYNAKLLEKLYQHTDNQENPHNVTAAQVGAIPAGQKGVAGGVASLDENGKVPANQLPEMSGGASAIQAALNTHIENMQNPHGVTAAQVGARPDTWMPTAAEVGALPDSTVIPDPYTLPVADSMTLGGVQPVAKTDAMTQGVGVDADGKLWSVPGGGGESGWKLIIDTTLTEAATFTTGEHPDASEVIVQLAVPDPGTGGNISSATSFTLFGGMIYYAFLRTANAGGITYAHAVKVGNTVRGFYFVGKTTTTTPGFGTPFQANTTISHVMEGRTTNNIPASCMVELPAGTQIRVAVK